MIEKYFGKGVLVGITDDKKHGCKRALIVEAIDGTGWPKQVAVSFKGVSAGVNIPDRYPVAVEFELINAETPKMISVTTWEYWGCEKLVLRPIQAAK